MEYTSFDDLKNLLGTESSGMRKVKSSFQPSGLTLGGTMLQKKTHSGTFIGNSRMQDNLGNFGDDEYLVINKDQDIIDNKSYKGENGNERQGIEGYTGIDQYE